MKQQSITADQVIEIIDESKDQAKIERIRNDFYLKAATVLGVVQIICGIVALAFWIFDHDNNFYFGKGIWTFILFFFSGLLTLSVPHIKNIWLISASMILSIGSTIVCACLLYAFFAGISSGGSDDGLKFNNIVMVGLMVMTSTASALLTAFAHLRPSTFGQSKLRQSGSLVHFNSSQLDLTNHEDLHIISDIQMNPTNHQDFKIFKNPTNLQDLHIISDIHQNPTNLQDLPSAQPSLDKPPTYQEVTELRQNCT